MYALYTLHDIDPSHIIFQWNEYIHWKISQECDVRHLWVWSLHGFDLCSRVDTCVIPFYHQIEIATKEPFPCGGQKGLHTINHIAYILLYVHIFKRINKYTQSHTRVHTRTQSIPAHAKRLCLSQNNYNMVAKLSTKSAPKSYHIDIDTCNNIRNFGHENDIPFFERLSKW